MSDEKRGSADELCDVKKTDSNIENAMPILDVKTQAEHDIQEVVEAEHEFT